MIKAQVIADLPTAITAACLMHCRKHGAPAAREVLRHLKLAQATPQSARSEALLAEMCAGIEEMLAHDESRGDCARGCAIDCGGNG